MSVVRRGACLLGATTLLALALGLGFSAAASPGPGSPSVTDVTVDHGRLSAVLTLPGGGSNGTVDPGSLRIGFGTQPPTPASVAPIVRESRAAMVVVDTSGSMAGAGLTAAKSAAATFLAEMPAGVRVGLESFADRPRVLVAPTTDRTAFRTALGSLRATGSTSLYDALRLGIGNLGSSGSRTIVLLSDGADTISRTSRGQAEALVRASGVRLAVVGFHTGQTQNGVLAAIAAAGQGTVTEALDPASLRRAFSSAAREIATQVRFTVPVPSGTGGTQSLTITGQALGRSFTVHSQVLLPAAAAAAATGAAPAPAVVTAPAVSHQLLWVAAGAVFAGLLVLVLAAAAPQFAPAARRRIRALDSYFGPAAPSTSTSTDGIRSLRGLSQGMTRAADAYIGKRASATRTGLMLERADLPLQLNEWYILRVLAVPISGAVCWTLFRDSGGRVVLALLGAVLVGGLLPVLLLRHLAARRARQFELQLPDVLTLISSSLSTGFSLPQAIDGISRDAAEPSAKEFSRALAETRIGVDLEDALDRTADRMGSVNLAWTTMAVRIQRRVGGNLAEVMRTTAKTLRDRETLRRQVHALSAEGRLSAYILLALPVLMAFYLYLTNRTYLALLWQRPIGLVMLSVSGALLVIGVFWMRRVANVKV